MPMRRLAVRLPHALHDRLHQEARARGVPVAEVIRSLLWDRLCGTRSPTEIKRPGETR